MQSNLKKSASGNARDSGEIDRSISQSVHPFLQTERNKCSFDKEYLTQLVDGGEYITKIRRNMEKLVESQDEVKNAPKFHFMTREQVFFKHFLKFKPVFRIFYLKIYKKLEK